MINSWLEEFNRVYTQLTRYPWIENLISVLVILTGTLIIWLVLARATGRTRRMFHELLEIAQQPFDPLHFAMAQRRLTALRLVYNGAKYALFACALALVLTRLGFKLDSLLLPAGFLGAALGMGAQNLVRDIVSGLFIVFEGQFAVDDVVSINNVLGTVQEVGLRVTRLRDAAGQIHYFPNGAITTVARYPQRHVGYTLMVNLAEEGQRAAAQAATTAAATAFGTQYQAFARGDDEGLQVTAESPTSLHLQLKIHPARVAVTKEKLSTRVTQALEAAGVRLAPAGVDLVDMPAL